MSETMELLGISWSRLFLQIFVWAVLAVLLAALIFLVIYLIRRLSSK